MTSATTPHSSYTVKINPLEPSPCGVWTRISSTAQYIIELPLRTYNTYLLIKKGELREPLSLYCKPDQFMGTFKTLFMDWEVTACLEVMRVLLAEARDNPEKGPFIVDHATKEFQQLYFDLFPSSTKDNTLLFCHESYVKRFKDTILGSLKPKNLDNLESDFDLILEETEKRFSNKTSMNATEVCRFYTTTVISKAVLGHPGPSQAYADIAESLDFLNRYALRRAFHIPPSSEEKKEYPKSLAIIRDAINLTIETNWDVKDSLVYSMLAEDFSLHEIQANLFLMYMGGSETAAALLSYISWLLAAYPEIQEEVINEIAEKKEKNVFPLSRKLDSVSRIFKEGIRLFTPAPYMGRQVGTSFELKVEDKKGQTVFSKTIKEGHGVLVCTTFAARNPAVFKDPDKFDPSRFKEEKGVWYPFGDSPRSVHFCPGQWLATTESKIFITWLIQKYQLSAIGLEEPKLQAFATLKTKDDIIIDIKKREST